LDGRPLGFWTSDAATAGPCSPAPWPDAPEGRTRREIMARGMGLRIFRAWGRPRPELDEAARASLITELPAPDFDAAQGKPARRRRRR